MRGEYIYVPLDLAQTPANGEVLCDRWWTVHPEKGVAFYWQGKGYYRMEEPAPQCNSVEWIARKLTAKLNPDCDVVQLPAVYMRHALRAAREHDAALARGDTREKE